MPLPPFCLVLHHFEMHPTQKRNNFGCTVKICSHPQNTSPLEYRVTIQNGVFLLDVMRYPPCVRYRLVLNINLERPRLPSSHHAGGRKCGFEWLGRRLSSSTLPEVERSIHSLSWYGAQLPVFFVHKPPTRWASTAFMFQTWSSRSGPIQIFLDYWFVSFFFLQPPPTPRSLCPSHPSIPPVCESLVSALVAVQMALCWCFTMGLRSVCLMPSTHSNFSTAAGFIYVLSQLIPEQASGFLMCTRLYCGLEIRGSYENPQM